MKAKHLFLAAAALLAAAGLWLAQSAWRAPAPRPPSLSGGMTASNGPAGGDVLPQPGQMLRPPDPSQRFRDFTPEQRVEFMQKGHGPGG